MQPPGSSQSGGSILARLFVIIGGLLVLVLTAALVVPLVIDWSGYRADFEREATAILGRRVTVQGEATARLLPFPSVTFSDVSVAGGPNGEPAMTVETFAMDAELAPLMSGQIRIFDMRLVRPKAILTVADSGTIDWAVRPSVPFDAAHIVLEKLTVTEGQVVIRHKASGRDHVLSEINTDISAKSLAGPWRIDGAMRIDGARTAVHVSTGKVDETGAMRVRVTADPAVYPFYVEADGGVTMKDGALVYAGTFKLDARSISKDDLRGTGGQTFALKDDGQGKPLPPAYRLKGKFAFDHARLEIAEFRMETGSLEDPYTADGSALIELGAQPRFDIVAKGAQVRFDQNVADAPEGRKLSVSERIAALEAVLIDLPKPTIPGTVEVNLPAVVAGDTTIRDVKISAEPAPPRGWNVKEFHASLPGRTTLEGSGLLAAETTLGFTGRLTLAVGQPSGFAAWVSEDVDEAIRRLPNAGIDAQVDLTRQRQQFSNMELILGGAKFRGTLDRKTPESARETLAFNLDGGALDLDGLSAFASLFVSDGGVNRAADTDVDVALKAGPVAAAGLTADTVDTAMRIRGGTLEIDRLAIGGLAGANLSATGRLKDFAGRPNGTLDLGITGADLAPLASVLAAAYPDSGLATAFARRAAAHPGLLAEAELDMQATLQPDEQSGVALTLASKGTLGGSRYDLKLDGSFDHGVATDRPLDLTFTATNDDASALLALYGVPILPVQSVGAAETTLTLKGIARDGLSTVLAFKGTDASANYNGAIAFTDEAITAQGAATLQAADIEPWLLASGVTLPGMGFGTGLDIAADVTLDGYALKLDALKGTINESALSGALALAPGTNGVLHATGTLASDAIDLAPAIAIVLGDGAMDSDGISWPETPFVPTAGAGVTAEIALEAGAISAGLLGTVNEASLTLRLDTDGLRVSDLKAKADDGDVTGLFELKNTGGTALFSSQVKLANADLSMLLPGTGIAGRAEITANLTASGKSIGGMIAAMNGSGTATVSGLIVPALNPDALPAIIEQANAVGREIDATKVAGFAPALVGGGNFAAAPAEIAFTIANGTLRAPPARFENAAAAINADLRADFGTASVAAAGEIVYAAGDEALVGSEPLVRFSAEGPLEAIVASLDTEPLAQFLTQRALEIEQARVEAMQAVLLEKQRLRREVRYYASLQTERDKAAEALLKQEEEARARAREEAERKAREEAEAKAKADAEAKAKADAEAKAKADEEARQRAEEEARLKAEAEARAAAEAAASAEARQRAEEEAALAVVAKKLADDKRKAEAAAQAEADARAREEAELAVIAKRVAEQKKAEEARKAAQRQAAPRPDPSAEANDSPFADPTLDTFFSEQGATQ